MVMMVRVEGVSRDPDSIKLNRSRKHYTTKNTFCQNEALQKIWGWVIDKFSPINPHFSTVLSTEYILLYTFKTQKYLTFSIEKW